MTEAEAKAVVGRVGVVKEGSTFPDGYFEAWYISCTTREGKFDLYSLDPGAYYLKDEGHTWCRLDRDWHLEDRLAGIIDEVEGRVDAVLAERGPEATPVTEPEDDPEAWAGGIADNH